MCDVCGEIVTQEKAARVYRVMHTYTLLAQAFDAFACEATREITLVSDFGETPLADKAIIEGTQRVLNELGIIRDGFARMAAALSGETRFKTGEIHRLFDTAHQLLHEPDADTETIADALFALLPPA